MDSENDEPKEGTPTVDDERTSSPFESGNIRRRDGKIMTVISQQLLILFPISRQKKGFSLGQRRFA